MASPVPTPRLVLDPDAFFANLDTMAARCAGAGLALRPHFKAHRCLRIAREQLARGAIGLTTATLGEVEVLARGGVVDILLANEIADAAKVTRLGDAAGACRLTVAVAHPLHVELAAAATRAAGARLGVLVEVDVGLARAGLPPEEAVALAQRVAATPGLELRGLMGYEGHVMLNPDAGARRVAVETASVTLAAVRADLEALGLPCPVVSGGGTGTSALWGPGLALTEVQAGSYVGLDTVYQDVLGPAGGFAQALFIETTVIAAPRGALRTLDAGLKSMSTDHGMPRLEAGTEGEVLNVADEHTLVRVADAAAPPAVGDRVRLVPSHIDPTINLHDVLWVGEEAWPVEARGASN